MDVAMLVVVTQKIKIKRRKISPAYYRFLNHMKTISMISTHWKACAVSLVAILGGSLQLQAEEPTAFSKREKKGLLETSSLLQSRGKIALIPKGSILFLPKQFEGKVVTTNTNGKLVGWKEFYRANSSWIHMYPVSFKQAAGIEKIPQERLKALAMLNKIVIAQRGSNLISVSPKALEPEEAAAESGQ